VSNEQFTQAMYQNVLGREADANGYSYWTAEMEVGTIREAILPGCRQRGKQGSGAGAYPVQ
jgi:hypothetical protein